MISLTAVNRRKSVLVFLFALTYMISYITRINYGAIISEMEASTGMSKSVLSLSLTGSFITYGTGQIISGILGDRFSPKKLVSSGLALSVLMNIAVPFCRSAGLLVICWCINGFAQSFMWPPLVRLMTASFKGEAYKNATVKVSWGSSLGTIIIYIIAPLIISFAGWKWVFWFSAICGVAMIIVWNLLCPDGDAKIEKAAKATKNKSGLSLIFTPLMISIMLSIVLQGMLRDGVATWMPSYISETYDLSSVISILTGVVLPIFSIICFQMTAFVHRVWIKNPLTCAGAMFALGSVSAITLYLFSGSSAVASVILSAILTASMHGVNLLLICMLPQYFQKYGNVSTVSGVLNSCTYIGSAASTYGIALISERFSWGVTSLVWFVIALVGTAICFVCAKPWKNKIGE